MYPQAQNCCGNVADLSQRSSLRSQSWAVRRKSVGVGRRSVAERAALAAKRGALPNAVKRFGEHLRAARYPEGAVQLPNTQWRNPFEVKGLVRLSPRVARVARNPGLQGATPSEEGGPRSQRNAGRCPTRLNDLANACGVVITH